MPALSFQASRRFAPAAPPPPFGLAAGSADEGTMQWLLKRNCSLAPARLLASFGLLCVVSLAIAGAFWWRGAPLVMPFAGAELFAIGLALSIYARHATDHERLSLRSGLLSVERAVGRRTERIEFAPAWVRVEPRSGDRSLIEHSGEGKRVAVGRFVRPEQRRALADELRAALRRCGPAPQAHDEPGS